MSSSTFPLFSNLPPELRIQVWHAALSVPDEDRNQPVLYPYKRGCWCPRWLSPSDPGYHPDCEPNIDVEFRHDLLDGVQVGLPLASVNREARDIALAWARQHEDIVMRLCEDRDRDRQCRVCCGSCVFIRLFKPERDVVYIATNRLYDFCAELCDRIEEPDLFDHTVNVVAALSRFAVPVTLLDVDEDPLRDILDDFGCFAVLFIILNTPPPEFPDNENKVQQRWELTSPRDNKGRRALVWNHDHRGFGWEDGGCDGEDMGDEVDYRRIEEASRGLIPMLVGNGTRRFEIRPVFAVRR